MTSNTLQSKFGTFTLVASKRGLQRVFFGDQHQTNDNSDSDEEAEEVLKLACSELGAYFSGKLRHWQVPLDFRDSGTPFQREVWEALSKIPYGETRSYKEIAASISRPKAVRAIGQANHNNPIPIVIPCHRVVGHNGKLVGYGGGLELKQRLLSLESEALKS